MTVADNSSLLSMLKYAKVCLGVPKLHKSLLADNFFYTPSTMLGSLFMSQMLFVQML
jgi:hypothetical protein